MVSARGAAPAVEVRFARNCVIHRPSHPQSLPATTLIWTVIGDRQVVARVFTELVEVARQQFGMNVSLKQN